ncbi:MAG: hypothetical protein ACKOXB_06115 [Flavobacteriales bacterium]
MIIRILLYFAMNAIGYGLMNIDAVNVQVVEVVFIVFYLIGMIFEFKVATHRYWLLPPTIFAVYTIINNMISAWAFTRYNVGEWLYFSGDSMLVMRSAWYSMVASHVLWIGFYLIPDFKVTFFKKGQKIVGVSNALTYGFVAISLMAFFIGIRLGVYGYVREKDAHDYSTYLKFAVNLGLLAIVFLTVYNYEDPVKKRLIYILLVVYFFVGLGFGSKTTAVAPMILVCIALYMTKRKIKKQFVLVIALGIFVSYLVIEPFRKYYTLVGDQYNVKDITEYVQLYRDAFSIAEDVKGEDVESQFLLDFLQRQSYVAPMSMTIYFADTKNYYVEDEWKHIALSPLYAIVPRFMWSSKPLANFGHWASYHIYESSEENSIGITPQGYAYLSARMTGILLFFLLFGLMQKLMFNILYLNPSYIPFYILFLLEIAYPGEVPWTFLAGSIKSVVMVLPIIAFLVFTKFGILAKEEEAQPVSS